MQKKGRFSSEWIAQLKQKVSLIEVASENIDLKKTGNRYMGRCPFHGDRTPSFSVNKDFYYCFGCKETGDAISFMTKLHGLSFEEALEDLAEKADLAIPESAYQLTSEEEKALYLKRQRIQKASRLNHFASLQYYHQNLLKDQSSLLFQEAREYLKKRGISAQTIQNFQVGVAGAQHDGLVQFLTAAKAPLDLAREFGLIRPSQKQAGDYDFFRERVTFPLIDMRGRVCGFGGRLLPSIDSKSGDQKLPKYLNSAESDLFQKSKFLYGLYQAKLAIREEEFVVVVEGYFDVISMHQSGFENVVATCGTSLTDDHLKILTRLAKKIIVFFDQDNAGISATVKAMELGLRHGLLLYGIPFESKLDPDEFLLENPEVNLAKMKEWVSKPFPLLDHLIVRELKLSENDVELRSQAIKKIAHWLQEFTDVVGRSLRVDQLIQKWKIPAQALGSLAVQAGGPRPAGRPIPVPRPNSGSSMLQSQSGQAQNLEQQRVNPPYRRRGPIKMVDRQILHFLVKFNDYGQCFLEARKLLPEKDSLSVFFDDTEVKTWVTHIEKQPTGFSLLKQAPETLTEVMGETLISQELRSVIMEGLLQESVSGDEEQLKALLNKGIYKGWVRFSHEIGAALSVTDPVQDAEKFEELSEQYLDLQRKLKEFKESYVSGKQNEPG